jgi:hypothetical protein
MVHAGYRLEQLLPLWGTDLHLRFAGVDERALSRAGTAETLREIAACFGDTSTEAHDRSTTNYVLLHGRSAPAEYGPDRGEGHIVRLILFIRPNQVPQ